MMSDLLFEIFSEEIPARMQENAGASLMNLVLDGLKKNGLTYDQTAYYYTPRRLTVHVTGIPSAQESFAEDIKGPRVDSPSAALQGFLKKNNLDNLAGCVVKNIDGTDYYFAQKYTQAGKTVDMLGEVLTTAITRMTWPKSMRWSDFDVRWVRPFHNILALFDADIIPGQFNFSTTFKLTFNNYTFGHRFLSNGQAIVVSGFADYQSQLDKAGVLLDQKVRRSKIWTDVQAVAARHGYTIKSDEKLLNEVAGLVECPVPFMGTFPESFLAIPAEVISTSMREHQRYFSVLGPDGKIVNHFICVANVQPADGGKTIIYGNEKVLKARLSDARFFWDQDLKTKLDDYLPRLQQIRFHEKLGTMHEKSERLKKLAGHIARLISADVKKAERAAYLAKADLVTGMVREFPELQGIMGGYYAKHSAEDPSVANAISSHYSPVGPNDSCPTDKIAVAVALADKIDTLVGFFSINEKPTGSKDPFALRRAALGVIRLILENKIDLDFSEIIAYAATLYGATPPSDLTDFVYDRLKGVLLDQSIPHKVVESVFAANHATNIYRTNLRSTSLADYMKSPEDGGIFDQLKRVVNILASEKETGKEDLSVYNAPDFSAVIEEKNLYEAIISAKNSYSSFIATGDYKGAIKAISDAREPLAKLFDGVMILDKDVDVRNRRIFLLRQIENLFKEIAEPKLLF